MLEEAGFREYALKVIRNAGDSVMDLLLRPYDSYDSLREAAAWGERRALRLIEEIPYPPIRAPRVPEGEEIEDLGGARLVSVPVPVPVPGSGSAPAPASASGAGSGSGPFWRACYFVPKSWDYGPEAVIAAVGISNLLEGAYPKGVLDSELWDVVEHRKGLALRMIRGSGYPEEVALEAAMRSTKVWPVLTILLGRDVTELYGVLGSKLYIDHIEAGRVEVSNIEIDEREFEKIRTLAELHPYARLGMRQPSVKVELRLSGSLVRVAIDVPPLSTPSFDARNLSALPRLSLPRLIRLGTIDEGTAAVLLQLMYEGVPILIAGRTGVGKTTLANSLLAFSSPGWRIISVEEVREIEDLSRYGLKHQAYTTPGSRGEAVLLFLHRNPDLVFLGEILNREHAEAFGLAKESGFRVLATTHARDHGALERKWAGWGTLSSLEGCAVVEMEMRRVVGVMMLVEGDWERVSPSPGQDFLSMVRRASGCLENSGVVRMIRRWYFGQEGGYQVHPPLQHRPNLEQGEGG